MQIYYGLTRDNKCFILLLYLVGDFGFACCFFFFLSKSFSRDQVLSQWSSKNTNEVVKFQELSSVSRFNTSKQNNIWVFIYHLSTIWLLPHLSADVAGFPLQIPQEEKISQSFMEQVATGILLWAEKLMWTCSYCQCSTFYLLHWFDTTGWAVNPQKQQLKSCLSWKIKRTAFLMISGSPVLVTDSFFPPSSFSTKKSKTTLLSRFGTLLPPISRSKYYTSFELQAFNADTVLVPVNHCLEVAGLPIYLWNCYQTVPNRLNRSWLAAVVTRLTTRPLFLLNQKQVRAGLGSASAR